MTVNKTEMHLYQKIAIEAYGPFPIQCRCGELIHELSLKDGVVHHKNLNRHDHNASNLEIMHHTCHTRLHRSIPHSDEARKKISNTMKGRVKTQEHQAKITASLQNRIFTDEWRQNISKATQKQGECSCGKIGRRTVISRHANKEGHTWSKIVE